MLDYYCERCGPGLLAEPVNAFSNLVFFVSAYFAWRLARRRGVLSPRLWLLIGLCVSVALGSMAFHMLANSWSNVLDVVPILLFQLWFLGLYLHEGLGLRPWRAAALVVVYLAVCLLMLSLPLYLNGSVIYAPTLASIVSLAIVHRVRRLPEPWLMTLAVGFFTAALTFRTIDMLVCPWFPIGTHFLWHLLNGVVFYAVMRVIVQNRAAAGKPGGSEIGS